jgi:hypothetical protein
MTIIEHDCFYADRYNRDYKPADYDDVDLICHNKLVGKASKFYFTMPSLVRCCCDRVYIDTQFSDMLFYHPVSLLIIFKKKTKPVFALKNAYLSRLSYFTISDNIATGENIAFHYEYLENNPIKICRKYLKQ